MGLTTNMSVVVRVIALLALAADSSVAVRLPAVHEGPQPDWVSVDNGVIRVGVDKNRGGSITYLSGMTDVHRLLSRTS